MGHGDMSGLWIPESTWMKDAMLHVQVTLRGTGRIRPLQESKNGQTTVAQLAAGGRIGLTDIPQLPQQGKTKNKMLACEMIFFSVRRTWSADGVQKSEYWFLICREIVWTVQCDQCRVQIQDVKI